MKQHIALTNSEIMSRISEIIHSKRDREIMRLKLIASSIICTLVNRPNGRFFYLHNTIYSFQQN